MDFSDTEERLLVVSTIGWVLVGALAAVLARRIKRERKEGS
jgi:uncharacterized membrane protein YeaQ/YmgE (transglycosylase-associated protein family)